jgi:hypothetical protein
MTNKRKNLCIQGSLTLIVAIQLLISTNAHSQEDLASRRAAAERYEATMPVAKMLEESVEQIALSLPDDQRATFVAQMLRVIDGQQLRSRVLEKMIEVFSADELDALATFYGSAVGQSVVAKFPVYMAEMMPLIQLELARAAGELKERSR